MGLFDFLFGNKKEKERLAKEREAEQERIRLAEEKKIAEERERRLAEHRKKEQERLAKLAKEKKSEPAPLTETKSNTTEFSPIQDLVNKCIKLELNGEISELQNNLFALYKNFNCPGGGKLITSYKEKENLSLCFSFLLQYDWMHDSDLREVFAENGFYCIIEHMLHQQRGRQGQAEAMMILFTLLCVGRDSLKPKIQDILNKAQIIGNPIFHQDDYRIGAQNVIDQFSLMAVSGARDLGPAGAPIMGKIIEKYNGGPFFEKTIYRKDLMKYDVSDIFGKARFIHDIIESILNEM